MSQKEQPLVSIIILNYNAGKLLLDCVDSVFLSNYKNFGLTAGYKTCGKCLFNMQVFLQIMNVFSLLLLDTEITGKIS